MIQYYWSKAFDFNQSNGQSASAANDLAVLVLSSRLVYAENLGPVCLPQQPPPPPGTQVANCQSARAASIPALEQVTNCLSTLAATAFAGTQVNRESGPAASVASKLSNCSTSHCTRLWPRLQTVSLPLLRLASMPGFR